MGTRHVCVLTGMIPCNGENNARMKNERVKQDGPRAESSWLWKEVEAHPCNKCESG